MLLYIDSFDHYLTADAQQKYWLLGGGMAIGAGTGRHTSNSLRASAAGDTAIRPCAGSNATVIVGVAVKSPLGGSPNVVLAIWDSGTAINQVLFVLNADGTISAWRGAPQPNGIGNTTQATLLGTSLVALSANVYSYLECRVVLSDTVGAIDVRSNGVPVLTLTGIDTVASASSVAPYWTSIALGTSMASPLAIDWDDLYVCDGAGAAPWNTFLGDCRVDPRRPTGPGATTDWAPTPAGANWANVDDATPNGDTDYNSGTPNQVDLFDVQDIVAPGTLIFGVQHCFSMKKTDAGLCSVAPAVRHAGTTYVGTNMQPTVNYAMAGTQVAQTNPGTGAQWTEADFNAAQFGYKRTV